MCMCVLTNQMRIPLCMRERAHILVLFAQQGRSCYLDETHQLLHETLHFTGIAMETHQPASIHILCAQQGRSCYLHGNA